MTDELNKKILIVDDEPTMRMIIRRILWQMGLRQVAEACDGKEALCRLKAEHYAIVVVDWNMPHLSGIELLRAIRAIPSLQQTPVLMVTAEDNQSKVVEAIEAGVNQYVIKPFTPKQFEEKVRHIFDLSP